MAGYSTTTLPTKTAVFSDEDNHFDQKFDDTIMSTLMHSAKSSQVAGLLPGWLRPCQLTTAHARACESRVSPAAPAWCVQLESQPSSGAAVPGRQSARSPVASESAARRRRTRFLGPAAGVPATRPPSSCRPPRNGVAAVMGRESDSRGEMGGWGGVGSEGRARRGRERVPLVGAAGRRVSRVGPERSPPRVDPGPFSGAPIDPSRRPEPGRAPATTVKPATAVTRPQDRTTAPGPASPASSPGSIDSGSRRRPGSLRSTAGRSRAGPGGSLAARARVNRGRQTVAGRRRAAPARPGGRRR